MEKTAEQVYAELLRQLARPDDVDPGALAEAFREVERMHATGEITDWQLQNASEAYARTDRQSRGASGDPGLIAGAGKWVLDKTKHGLHSAAGQARARATRAVANYTNDDPVRAMLVSAAAGALAMAIVAMLVRSAARKVRSSVES